MYEKIYYLSKSDTTLPFNINICGISYCDESYSITREHSSVYVMEYICSGSGTVNEDNKTVVAAEGDVYLLKSRKKHHYYSHKDTPWTKIWFNFYGTLADKIIESYSLENEILFHAPELKPYFEQIIQIAQSSKNTLEARDEIAVVFLQLAQKLNQKLKKDTVSSAIAKKLKNLLDNQNHFDTDLKSITDTLYCSENHAIRVFKQAFGITPYEYLQQKRFTMAKSMLKNTAMSISDIAAELDFYDIHYFSVCFKKRFGITPRAYRKG